VAIRKSRTGERFQKPISCFCAAIRFLNVM